jgi:hypothetical protein
MRLHHNKASQLCKFCTNNGGALNKFSQKEEFRLCWRRDEHDKVMKRDDENRTGDERTIYEQTFVLATVHSVLASRRK